MANPWDIPPQEKNGDPAPETIWLAVGKALSRWEEVEGALADLFSGIVFPAEVWTPQVPPAVRAYGSVVGGRSRKDMIGAAANEFFLQRTPEQFFKDAELQSDMKTLLNKTGEFASRRNDFAHGIVMPQIFEDGGHNGNYLFPGLYASKKWKDRGPIGGEPTYAYTANQIDAFAEFFDDLQNEIYGFPSRFFAMQE